MLFNIIYITCCALAVILYIVVNEINNHRRYCLTVDGEYFQNVRVEFHPFLHEVTIYPEDPAFPDSITIRYRRLGIERSCWKRDLERKSFDDQL